MRRLIFLLSSVSCSISFPLSFWFSILSYFFPSSVFTLYQYFLLFPLCCSFLKTFMHRYFPCLHHPLSHSFFSSLLSFNNSLFSSGSPSPSCYFNFHVFFSFLLLGLLLLSLHSSCSSYSLYKISLLQLLLLRLLPFLFSSIHFSITFSAFLSVPPLVCCSFTCVLSLSVI